MITKEELRALLAKGRLARRDREREIAAMRQSPTVALTEEQVRALLAEGREVRAELEKRLDRMHQIDPRDAERKAR